MQSNFFSRLSESETFNYLASVIQAGLIAKGRQTVSNLGGWPKRAETLFEPLPETGMSLEDLLIELQTKFLNGGMNFTAPGYLGFPDSCNSVAAMAGALLADLLPQNLINSRRWAPDATYIEVATVLWMRGLVGYATNPAPKDALQVGGYATPGGVLSNALALLVARENLVPGAATRGLRQEDKIRVVIPKHIDHYSIFTSVGWIGIGRDAVLRSPVKGYRYDLKALRETVKGCADRGERIIVVAYAGDSRSLSVDNLDGIADICEEFGAWFHVDACHGIQLTFSAELSKKLKGLSRAKSLTADPHKVFWTPHTLSYVLFRDPDALRPLAGASDLVTTEAMSLGAITPLLGTKRFDALKFWCLVKNLGSAELGRLIEQRHELALEFARLIDADSEFLRLGGDVDINGVVFMYVGAGGAKSYCGADGIAHLNRINWTIHERLLEGGEHYLHTFLLPDLHKAFGPEEVMLQPLRFMTGNPTHTISDIQSLLHSVKTIGRELCGAKA